MKRREFISLITGAAASPLVARAQQPAKTKRIALVHPSDLATNMVPSYAPFYHAFFDEIGRVGFVEGKNLIVERYSGAGQSDRFAQLARDVVDTYPDAITAFDAVIAFYCKTATKTIPIVTVSPDPVAVGLVPSIARPGGNLTGIAVDAGLEIWGKRLGVLKEVLPRLSNVSILMTTRGTWEGPYGSGIREAAKNANIRMNGVLFESAPDEAAYQHAFAEFERDRPDALMISESPIHLQNWATIVGLAAKHRLPGMYTWKEFVEGGGLMSYSFDLVELGHLIGHQTAQVLSGTNPADLPFIQVTRLLLALNLKTAKSLGIEFPATLLGSADFIIE